MNAEEYLKTLNEHDPVFEIDTEYEYTEQQLINFAERYHERKLKILRLQNVMHSVFTIHSTENDEIIKVVGTKDKAIQEVKEFKDDHAYADFYWQEQVLK